MRDILDAIRSIRKRIRRIRADPARYIEYNKFVPNHRVSPHLYTVDIARNPRVVSNDFQSKDVQGMAGKANNDGYILNRKDHKVRGRS